MSGRKDVKHVVVEEKGTGKKSLLPSTNVLRRRLAQDAADFAGEWGGGRHFAGRYNSALTVWKK